MRCKTTIRFLLTSILLIVWTQTASAGQLTIVALGASNTAGYGVAPEQAYPIQLEAMLRARHISARVINAGINGDTLKGMLLRLDSAIIPGTQLVILDATRNGFGGKAEEWAACLAKIRRRLEARGIKVIVIFPSRYYVEMRQPDRIHLSAEAHSKLAARLLPEVIAAAGLTGDR
jgi:acyl-CoA thioesterase-1